MNTTKAGDLLESQIYELFCAEIAADRFWSKNECCKVFRKKGYFSKDREANIIFDLSIEIYLPGQIEYSLVVLIECKNYTHSVPVDDAEEFFIKVEQVAAANAKAVMVSTAAFQAGARAYAKSKKMGLMRYFGASDFKWELLRSASACARSTPVELAESVRDGLLIPGFKSSVFDLYMQSPSRDTNSLGEFLGDLVGESNLTPSNIQSVKNKRFKFVSQVPYVDKEELEIRSTETLGEIGYRGGEVDLGLICDRERDRFGLTVHLDVSPNVIDLERPTLGRINFRERRIEIYSQPDRNHGRERFTLAHELSHHLLGHGQFLLAETCEEDDFYFDKDLVLSLGSADIFRLEFQANYYAASLLMPGKELTNDFYRIIRSLNIGDRGFGSLYVDEQSCNVQNYMLVTTYLMAWYGVSRAAVSIRLEELELLRDARQKKPSSTIRFSLDRTE
jgi:Zn-dependent peptidase ImmA (M78 family)